VIGEIDDVMTLITEALGMSAELRRQPERRQRETRTAKNRDQIKASSTAGEIHPRDARHQQGAGNRLSLSKTEISNLQHSLEAIRAESLTDPLTGLGNRKYFDRSIEMAVQTALASGEPLSLLMFDIDHFKSFNDSYGLTGDQVLRLVGMSLKQTIKGQDITARYGGEEFAVVLPNTALRQALTVADHIRRAVMAKELKKKSTGEILGRVTISVGVSMLKPGDDTDSLIERADACLYAAKRNGRNRVICEVDPEYAADPQPGRLIVSLSETRKPTLGRQRRQPIFGRLGFALGPLDQQPFLRQRFRFELGMSDPDTHTREARGQPVGRAFPPLDRAPGVLGRSSARRLAEIRSGSSRRPVLFSGLPFRLGPVPGGHISIFG
jgi:diguanylate cyclase